jgi:uncharacterized membrane protein YhhN
MTAPALALLVVASVFALGDWLARARHAVALEYLCKPATLVALLATALALTPAHDAGDRRVWFVAALACSLVGDIVLILPTDRFVAGLAAFLVGHLCYVAGLWTHGPGGVAFAVAAAVVVLIVAPVGRRILGALRGRRDLVVPVGLYMVVISVMLATALATGNVLAGVGAALFVASDAMIAWNRFVAPFRAADLGIMVTYHLGQAGLVLSLLH